MQQPAKGWPEHYVEIYPPTVTVSGTATEIAPRLKTLRPSLRSLKRQAERAGLTLTAVTRDGTTMNFCAPSRGGDRRDDLDRELEEWRGRHGHA